VQNTNKGMALIQVLLLIGILSVLVLYFTLTARQQVALAGYANERAQALVNMQSAKNTIIFRLLTEHKLAESQSEGLNQPAVPFSWNFYGQPFAVAEGVKATLQDQSGLLSGHFVDAVFLTRILIANGIEVERANLASKHLLDWQDIDSITSEYGDEANVLGQHVRNGHIPDLTDFSHIPGIDADVYQLLQQIMTIHYAGRFNPMTAPEPILRSLINEPAFLQVKALRDNAQLSKQEFSAITGLNEEEDIWFTPSNYIKMSITSNVDSISITQTWLIALNPYATRSNPINYIETHS
jgi:general secretion pathway protein K